MTRQGDNRKFENGDLVRDCMTGSLGLITGWDHVQGMEDMFEVTSFLDGRSRWNYEIELELVEAADVQEG